MPMPWKETCIMDQRTKFIAEWLKGEALMTELRAFIDILAEWKWIGQFRPGSAGSSLHPNRPMMEACGSKTCKTG